LRHGEDPFAQSARANRVGLVNRVRQGRSGSGSRGPKVNTFATLLPEVLHRAQFD
jgi:hypothetical protein